LQHFFVHKYADEYNIFYAEHDRDMVGVKVGYEMGVGRASTLTKEMVDIGQSPIL